MWGVLHKDNGRYPKGSSVVSEFDKGFWGISKEEENSSENGL